MGGCGGGGRKGGEGGGGFLRQRIFSARDRPSWRESRLVMWETIWRVVSHVVIPRPRSWRLWGGGRSPGGEWNLKKLKLVLGFGRRGDNYGLYSLAEPQQRVQEPCLFCGERRSSGSLAMK